MDPFTLARTAPDQAIAKGWRQEDVLRRDLDASAQPGDHRYMMRNCRHSSARFGPCEICGGWVSETHHQIEERCYNPGPSTHWTQLGCRSLFGHPKCLLGQRRPGSSAGAFSDGPTSSTQPNQ